MTTHVAASESRQLETAAAKSAVCSVDTHTHTHAHTFRAARFYRVRASPHKTCIFFSIFDIFFAILYDTVSRLLYVHVCIQLVGRAREAESTTPYSLLTESQQAETGWSWSAHAAPADLRALTRL